MTTAHRAADKASEYLRQGLGGLAIHKASQDFGIASVEITAELARRRKARRLQQEARNRPVKHWQETGSDG